MKKLDDLERLQQLKENGVLTEEEFNIEKQKVLDDNMEQLNFSTQDIEDSIPDITDIKTTSTPDDTNISSSQIKIKFNTLIIIIAIVIVTMLVVISINMSPKDNSVQKTNNVGNTVIDKKEYSKFVNDDIEKNKNVVDGYWKNIKTTKNIIKIKEKNWYNIKQEQEPFLNIARKEFFVNTNTVIALISIAHNEGKVVDIKFTGIAPDEIMKNNDNDILEGYGILIFSIPQLLKYATEDEELSKYLQDILVKCWDNNDWYLNEFRQGIKFSIGADKNNYLNIECCLSNYVSQ